jgi:hypothetical protein
MKKPPLVLELRVTGTASLEIKWSTGEILAVDFEASIRNYPAFSALRDPAVFTTAVVDDWGHGIEWPGYSDCEIGADVLYELCHEQAGIFSASAFEAWMQKVGASNETAAQMLGVTRRTIINYRTGSKPVSKVVTLACVALADAKPAKSSTPMRGLLPEEHYKWVETRAYFIAETQVLKTQTKAPAKGATIKIRKAGRLAKGLKDLEAA